MPKKLKGIFCPKCRKKLIKEAYVYKVITRTSRHQ